MLISNFKMRMKVKRIVTKYLEYIKIYGNINNVYKYIQCHRSSFRSVTLVCIEYVMHSL